MKFSRHAKNRMRQLKVTLADVEQVVSAPEHRDVDAQGRSRFGADVRGVWVRVVVAADDETFVVSVHERRGRR